MDAVSPAALTGVSDRDSLAMLPLPAQSCKKPGANHVEIFTSFLPSYTIIQQRFSSSWDCQEQGLILQQQAVSDSWDVSVMLGSHRSFQQSQQPFATCCH